MTYLSMVISSIDDLKVDEIQKENNEDEINNERVDVDEDVLIEE